MSGQGEAGVGGRRESRRTRRKREGWIRGGGRGQRGGFIRGDSPLFLQGCQCFLSFGQRIF